MWTHIYILTLDLSKRGLISLHRQNGKRPSMQDNNGEANLSIIVSNMKRTYGASLYSILLRQMCVVATSLLRDSYHHSSKFQFCRFIVLAYFII
jgi:hypothetical protein